MKELQKIELKSRGGFAQKNRHLRIAILGTTIIYTHVLNKGGRGVKSPLDSGGGAPPAATEPAAGYRVNA